MENQGIHDILKQLPATQYGAALKVFLLEEIKRIDSVDGVTTLSEIKGRQIAKKIIKEIFAFYLDETFAKAKKRLYN